jgi:diguanylate cyclase (GGDEF)-like protein/PAS domain S-box-containing protein
MSTGPSPIRVLLIEDVPEDAELVTRAMRKAKLDVVTERVDGEDELEEALMRFRPHVILSDYNMPEFGGTRALAIARARCPDVPFIFVSGTIGEERAIDALHQGAVDYVLKDSPARLVPAILRALEDVKQRESRRKAEQQLYQSEQRFSSVADATQEWIWEKDLSGIYTFCNHSATAILGYDPEELVGNSWVDYIEDADQPRARHEWERAVAEKRGWRNVVLRLRHKQGQARSLESTAVPLLDAQGTVAGFRGTSRDITERIQQQEKITRLSRIHAVSSGISGMIVRVIDRPQLFRDACHIAVQQGGFPLAWVGQLDSESAEGKAVAAAGIASDQIEAIPLTTRPVLPYSGWPASRALRDNRPAINNNIASDAAMAQWLEARGARGFRSCAALPLFAKGEAEAVLVLYADQREFFDRQEMDLLEQIAADLSFALDYLAKRDKLSYVSYQDPLTGLANRELFFDRLTQVLGALGDERGRLGVVVIDLQRFRLINDTLGRGAGDALLKEFAARLRKTFDDATTLSRIGGDRFAVSVGELNSAALAHLIETRVAASLTEPFVLGETPMQVGCKIGVALFPDDGHDAETLFRNAEAALQRAKDTTDTYAFYSPEMNAKVAARLHLEDRLRNALRQKQFVLHYQPKVDLKTRRIHGLEALIRWRHPERGIVAPCEFISVLEETGMIIDVGRWVIEQAVADIGHWRALRREVPRVAVNVSHMQVRQRDFVTSVLAAVGRNEGAVLDLDLEVTESLMLEDREASVAKIAALRTRGMQIYMDDFGTGYSNLSQIAALPLDSLKIDGLFIARMGESAGTTAIVSAIINLAKALEIGVVAEGVETEEQADLLASLGCDNAQGYLFGRPMPADETARLLDEVRA